MQSGAAGARAHRLYRHRIDGVKRSRFAGAVAGVSRRGRSGTSSRRRDRKAHGVSDQKATPTYKPSDPDLQTGTVIEDASAANEGGDHGTIRTCDPQLRSFHRDGLTLLDVAETFVVLIDSPLALKLNVKKLDGVELTAVRTLDVPWLPEPAPLLAVAVAPVELVPNAPVELVPNAPVELVPNAPVVTVEPIALVLVPRAVAPVSPVPSWLVATESDAMPPIKVAPVRPVAPVVPAGLVRELTGDPVRPGPAGGLSGAGPRATTADPVRPGPAGGLSGAGERATTLPVVPGVGPIAPMIAAGAG